MCVYLQNAAMLFLFAVTVQGVCDIKHILLVCLHAHWVFSVLHSPCKLLCGRKNTKFQDKSWHPASSFLRTAGFPCYMCSR